MRQSKQFRHLQVFVATIKNTGTPNHWKRYWRRPSASWQCCLIQGSKLLAADKTAIALHGKAVLIISIIFVASFISKTAMLIIQSEMKPPNGKRAQMNEVGYVYAYTVILAIFTRTGCSSAVKKTTIGAYCIGILTSLFKLAIDVDTSPVLVSGISSAPTELTLF